MRSELIRFLDRWCGSVICFLLTVWRKTIEIFGQRHELSTISKPQKILFLKLIEQGAMILSIPAIEQAKRMVGEKNVYVGVFKKNNLVLPLIKLIPLENIITIDTTNIFTLTKDIIRFCIICRKVKIDTVIDLEFFSRGSAMLAYLSGAKTRVGMHGFLNDTPYRGDLMTHRVSYNPYIHTAHMYCLMVESLKENPSDVPLLKIPQNTVDLTLYKFSPSTEKLQKWQRFLDSCFSSVNEPIYVMFSPNPDDLLKVRKWEIEHYIELGKKIIERYPNARFIITGMENEKDKIEPMVEELGRDKSVNLGGKTTLEDLLVLYSICDILITNDSGPAHFASTSSNIDIVVMFGPETPKLFSPLGKKVHVLYKELACSPCLNPYNYRFSFCKNNLCIKNITVEEVFEVVCKCLDKKLSEKTISTNETSN
ncbi:MAG: glycosyltransferase family 9 protein [Candidatus Hydrogenedentes bacterium]|nr:glycosyltransferase family 9 protein [Candidatus Hydrogenedentota bacterium]